jgi:AsmA protein
MQAQLKTQGQTTQALRRGLDGDLSFAFNDGAIEGINVAHLIRSAKAKLSGKTLPPDVAVQKTDFSSLTGTATIRSGVANNPDLSLKSPMLRIQGAGTADLVKEETDYKLDVAVVGTLEGEGGREIQDLKGLAIPLQITGPFAAPKVRLNLDDALKARATQELDKQKAKLQEKIDEARQEQEQQLKQKLEDTIKDKLKLF